MRKINVKQITEAVRKLCIDANINLRKDIFSALKNAYLFEKNRRAKRILEILLTNAELAKTKMLPICQDTGMVVVHIKLGQDVRIVGGDLKSAINKGVRLGYKEGFLRKSIVSDPLQRINSGTNEPAIIYTDIVRGNKIKITVSPKGFGCENVSRIKMFDPTANLNELEDFVVETAKEAGSKPCPPIYVGIGIGGTMEKSALLSKEALLRPITKKNELSHLARLEKRLLKRINSLGIGPMGLGGKTTALGVSISAYPTHIAGLPVSVSISCHATRSASKVI